MMALEGPFVHAVIGRLPDPTVGFAAFGVSMAIAVLIEAPVIMLLSASTALVEDAISYRRLQTFVHGLTILVTGVFLVVLIPGVHQWLTLSMLGLPPEVAARTYLALWCFLPWPAAIGYRRFWQGVLIGAGRTGRVGLGTVFRLLSMSVAAVALAVFTDMPGPAVGGAALSIGALAEAIVVRWMVREQIARLLGSQTEGSSSADTPEHLSFAAIGRFYVPLAMTSFVAIFTQPLLTFLIGRSAQPVESLAVFSVVYSTLFVFGAVALSFQDAVIALLRRNLGALVPVRRFGILLALTLSTTLGTIAFTPLSELVFVRVLGLTPELIELAVTTARFAAPLPMVAVSLSFFRGILVLKRVTNPIVAGTVVDLLIVALVFVGVGDQLGWPGAISAFVATFCGRAAASLYLGTRALRLVRPGGLHANNQA